MGSTRTASFSFSVPYKRGVHNPRLVDLVNKLRRSGARFVGLAGSYASGRMRVVAVTPDVEKLRTYARAKRLRFSEGPGSLWTDASAYTAFAMLEQAAAGWHDVQAFGAFSDFRVSANGSLTIEDGGFGFVVLPD